MFLRDQTLSEHFGGTSLLNEQRPNQGGGYSEQARWMQPIDHSPDDCTLVARIAQRDRCALEMLYARYRIPLFNVCCCLMPERE